MKLVSVFSPKGGVAKSTTSIFLAGAFVSRGYRVGLVSHDPQGTPAWLEKMAAQTDQPYPFTVIHGDPADPTQPKDKVDALAACDIVIIDHRPSLDKDNLPTIADVIVLLLKPDPADGLSWYQAQEIIETIGTPMVRVLTLFDEHNGSHVQSREAYNAELPEGDDPWLTTAPRRAVPRLVGEGLTPYSKLKGADPAIKTVRAEIDAIADRVEAKLGLQRPVAAPVSAPPSHETAESGQENTL